MHKTRIRCMARLPNTGRTKFLATAYKGRDRASQRGSLSAGTSTRWISAGLANRPEALAMRALATATWLRRPRKPLFSARN